VIIKHLKYYLLLGVLIFSGCDSTKPIELIYPDRVKFTFTVIDEEDEDDVETEYAYLCAKGETEKETKERAANAHKYFMEKLAIISDNFSDSIIGDLDENLKKIEEEGKTKKEDGFSMMDGIKAAIELQQQGEKLGIEVEKKYQCLSIE